MQVAVVAVATPLVDLHQAEQAVLVVVAQVALRLAQVFLAQQVHLTLVAVVVVLAVVDQAVLAEQQAVAVSSLLGIQSDKGD